MTELAHAYVALSVSTGGMKKDVESALRGIESSSAKTGESMGSKIGAGLTKTLKRTAIGAGVAAGGLLATGLTKGIGRLNAIENAESKLSGLGNSARTVEGVMTNALASVKGTAFGLDEAASTAAMVVASGIEPGQRLETVLKTVGDTAAIAGTSMSDMGQIFGSVAAKGKLQGDDLLQLQARGIPVMQMLAEETGKTTGEISDLISKGKIDFQIFADAMEKGVGGAALEMGNTTSGAAKNAMAALGRLGAAAAGPFYNQAAGAFRGVTDALDVATDAVGPWADRLDHALTTRIVPGLKDLGADALEAFANFRQSDFARDSLQRLEGVVGSLGGTARDLAPALGGIVSSLADASAALGVGGWELFLTTLEAVGGVASALVGPIETLSGLMQDHPALVTTAAGAWLAFKTVPGIMSRVSSVTAPVISQVSSGAGRFRDFGSAVRESYRYAGQANPQMGRFGQTMTILGANAQEAGRSIGSGIKSGVGTAVNALGGPLNIALAGAGIAIASGVAANQRLESSQNELAASSRDLAQHQRDMWRSIGDDAGVADAVAGQVQAITDGIDAAISGRNSNWSTATGVLVDGVKDAFTTNPFSSDSGGFFDGGLVRSEMAEAHHAANQLADVADLTRSALDTLGMSTDDVAAKVRGSQGDWAAFRSRLIEAAGGSQEAAAGLDEARAEFVAFEQAQALATPGALELSAAFDVLGDTTSSAADRVDALRSGMEALGLIQTSAEQKAFDLAASVDKLAESALKTSTAADAMGNEFFTVDGALNPLNANTRELNSRLGDLGDQFLKNVEATGSAAEAWGMVEPQLENVRTSLGLTAEEFAVLRAEYGLVPEVAETLVRAKGAGETAEAIGAVSALLGQLPSDVPQEVKLRVEDEHVIQALRDVGYEVEKIDGTDGMVTVSADNSLFSAAMSAVVAKTASVDAMSAVPDILADETVFTLKDADVRAKLAGLDTSTADPAIGALIQDFIAGRDITMSELAIIDGTKVEPHISAHIAEALQKAEQANKTLDHAARPRIAYIRAEYSSVDSSGTAVGHQYYRGPRPSRAAGGRIPGHAHGGRLPTTGPGTDTVDGILGVDSSTGTPTSWVDAGEWVVNRRSSDKYDRELAAINAGTFPKLPGYKDGGRVGGSGLLDFVMGRGNHGQSRPLQGAPYVWAGINWGDCSAAMSAIARFAVGVAPFAARFATGNMAQALAALGFTMGRGPEGSLRFGWYNGGPGGGHTSGTLPDGTNVEMRGGGRGGIVGGDAWPWNHARHTNHAFLKVEPDFDWSEKPYTGSRGAGKTVNATDGPSSRDRQIVDSLSGKETAPRTWSELAGKAAADIASGYTEDLLGVLGIPNQLPPILQAFNAMQEDRGEGVATDWELSVAAAEVKQLEHSVAVRERLTNEALRAINGTPLGDPGLGVKTRLDNELLALEADRLAKERAQARLDALLLTRRTVDEDDLDGLGIEGLTLEETEDRVKDRQDAIRRAEDALGDAKGGGNPEQIELAEARLDKARRELDLAKRELEEKKRSDEYAVGDGYNLGGTIPGSGGRDTVALAARPGEFLVNVRAATANRELLEHLNSGGQLGTGATQAAGGDTYYINALDTDDALSKLERRAAQRLVAGMGVR